MTDDPHIAIPGYRVTSVLGEGGMGTVYAAEQDDPKRPVAIKVLHVRSGIALARFKTEAQIMARLDHPGIARVLEAGEAGGHPFLVMERVDGVTLDRYVEPLPLERRLALFASLCDAVHHAHVKGVIHRDLKPQNVMVKADDHVVVLDFGVARLDDDTTVLAANATRAGDLLGTPVYMSPEQAMARPDEVDARSDVYTLGVILYELISDALPYEVRGLPLPAVTCVIVEDPPIPLVKRDRAFAGDLDAITQHALAKEPAGRYSSVAALADDVRRFLARLPVSVRVPGTRERLQRFVKRRPVVAATIAIAIAATAVFATVVTLLYLDARAARRVAEDARAAAESRTNQLTLGTARAALGHDPTEAIAWLKTLSARDVDPATAWGIAHEAIARGVAHDVVHAGSDEVHWVEPLPDGDGFVTAAYDGHALLWKGKPYAASSLYAAIRGRVHAVRPSPDGTRFAIGGDFGALHVVARDGRVLMKFAGHVGDVQHLAWSPDGAFLVTADDHGNAWLWPHGDAPGRQLIATKLAIGAIAFAPGAVLAASHDGTIWRWSLADLAAPPITTTVGNDVVELWADRDHVEAVDGEGTVRTWRVDDGALVIEHTVGTEQRLKRALFAPTGWVVLGGVGGGVTIVDGERVETIGHHRAQVRSIAISSDGRWIADGGDDGSLAVHDRATGRELELRGHAGRIRHLAFTRNGAALLSSDSDGNVRRWEIAAIPTEVFDAGGAGITKLAVSADGALVATIDEAGEVVAWKVGDGSRHRLGNIRGRVRELAIAAGTVVSGTAEGVASWWPLAGDPINVQLAGSIEGLATSADRVAVATSLGPIALFTTHGEAREVLPGHPGGTIAVAFDPTGTLLASGGQDRAIRVWRRGGDAFAADVALDGLGADTHYVMFAPDGGRLVAAGNDGEVSTWRVHGGVVDPKRVVAAKHVGAVASIAIDAAAIVSAGRDSTLIRTPLVGPATTTTLHATAIDLAIDAAGGIHAITRTGAVEHWDGVTGSPPVIEIDHGARAASAIGARWTYAVDSAVVIAGPHPRPLAELAAALARATDFANR